MLDRLYSHMLDRLTAISLQTTAMCGELIALLGRLHDGWGGDHARLQPPPVPVPSGLGARPLP